MDIIEANECLRAWFGRPTKCSFDDEDIGKEEGEASCDNHESGQSLHWKMRMITMRIRKAALHHPSMYLR
jgi:hypothetical protein